MIGTRKQVDSPDAGRREALLPWLPCTVAVEESGETGKGRSRGPMLSETHSETSAQMIRKARRDRNLDLVGSMFI